MSGLPGTFEPRGTSGAPVPPGAPGTTGGASVPPGVSVPPGGPGTSAPAGPGGPSGQGGGPTGPGGTPPNPGPGPVPNPVPAPAPAAPKGKRKRRARVRNRLLVSVTVVAAAIAGAGAPALLASSGELNDAQNLVTAAERAHQGISLAHALADERDEVIAFIAAGRPDGKGLSEQRSARVDRRIQELRAGAPAALRTDLDAVAAARRAALTGKSEALAAHQAYAKVITELHRLAEDVAVRTPPAAAPGARSLADLDRAVEQASAARGLLLAALAVPRSTTTEFNQTTGLMETVPDESAADARKRLALSGAAQQAQHRSTAALADFRDVAPAADLASYDSTVNGAETAAAERYLNRLTDEARLSDDDLEIDTKKVAAALSSRIDLMRGVEASLATARVDRLEQLRDDAVTELEIRVGVIGALLLLAVGVSMGMARSLTRPLAVLRIGSARLAADPAAEEPVRFTGRNDEFAQAVDSVNALHAHTVALHERLATLEGDRRHLIGERESMADRTAELRAELDRAAADLGRVRHSIQGTFVNLALRTLGLVERQLAVIEGLEDREQDPDRLSTLFKLDHFATVMRRHSENLLVLAGADHGHHHPGPVPLVDVARAAVSEIERYERVRITSLPPHVHIAGFAADDLSHLLAELLENATSFSPPDASVEVSGWLLENGEVMLSVQDEGIGMTSERLRELNLRLSEFDPADLTAGPESDEGLGLGLYVVARLAHRHGVRVQLREQKQGGVTAVAVLPKGMLAAEPAAATAVPPLAAGAAPALRLPGSEAEANSNVLRGRAVQGDPLIAAAETAVRHSETTMELIAPPSPPDTPETEPATEPESLSDEPRDHPRGHPGEQHTGEHFAGEHLFRDGDGESGGETVSERAGGPDEAPVGGAAGDEHGHHTRAHDEAPALAPGAPAGPTARTAVQGNIPGGTRVTDKGLPKRTPRISEPVTVARPAGGGVDADALRRKLGGFHQGAAAGRRDVEAEIGPAPAESVGRGGETVGDTVEEGSS
ncbi:nitrate- and nitrite sensing domain-containing protein [Streptomyces uncialis]|uniref:sensor histidine kinase n=1 Tax=Streptomyces uncialis TaxID=1048205 RepID=UPI0038109C89